MYTNRAISTLIVIINISSSGIVVDFVLSLELALVKVLNKYIEIQM